MLLENFKMIGSVDSLDLDKGMIQCSSIVPESGGIMESHFPGFPIFPGVLMIEAAAQAAGYLYSKSILFKKMAYLAKVDKARFSNFVYPGNILKIEIVFVAKKSEFNFYNASITVDSKTVFKGEITLASSSYPSQLTKNFMVERSKAVFS